jgi:hypothetical protein
MVCRLIKREPKGTMRSWIAYRFERTAKTAST